MTNLERYLAVALSVTTAFSTVTAGLISYQAISAHLYRVALADSISHSVAEYRASLEPPVPLAPVIGLKDGDTHPISEYPIVTDPYNGKLIVPVKGEQQGYWYDPTTGSLTPMR